MDAKKNLVLGLAKGYSWYVLEPFIRSFIKNVPNSDMVLFVGDASDFTMHMLEEVGKDFTGGELKLLPVPEKFNNFGHPANTRWKIFLDYLKEHGAEYNQILCADTRDVFFQGDIFESFSAYESYVGLSYFGENETLRENALGKNFPIWEWFINAFGKEEAEKLADKRTFCPSTILGTSKEIETLFDVLCKTIPNYDVFATDECTFDYIIHNKLIPVENILEISAETGEIMHWNVLNFVCPIKIENDLVLNVAGSVPKAIHFFDRHIVMLNLTDKLYRSKDFQLNENFLDKRSVLDQLPHLVDVGKYSEAFELFMTYLLSETKLNATFHAKDREKFEKMSFSTLTEEDKKALKSMEMKGYGDTLIRMWEVILEKNLPSTNSGELLEFAIQLALAGAYDQVLPLFRAEKIVACIKVAEKLGHVVSLNFKKFILEKLFERTKVFVEDANISRYMTCLDLAYDLNLPLDEKWQRIKNEAYSWFVFYTRYTYDEETFKKLRGKFESGKVFCRPYRVDADFGNGGIK